jgi:DNA-directed RNA polymerase subunit RPC12/RpoP
MASFVQRLVTRLMPGRAAEIERQSREWDVVCPTCGNRRSVWEIGGIRYKAASSGKRIGATCPSCGERGLFEVVRHPDGPGD